MNTIEPHKLDELLFIYRALHDGWIVFYDTKSETYKFKKPLTKDKGKQVMSRRKFVEKYMLPTNTL